MDSRPEGRSRSRNGKDVALMSSARAEPQQGDALGPLDATSADLMPIARLMARELRLRNEIQIDEPRWMILLELFVALGEAREVPFMSAAYASSAPVSTAQRYIHDMVKAGLLKQSRSGVDQRVTHVELTEAGRDMVSQILARTQALRAR